MPDPRGNATSWLRRQRRDGPAEVRLLCFHYAGGNAAMFRDWPHLLPARIEPVAVQLPGRMERLDEPPFTRMETLVDALIEVVEPLTDLPFACYGASMGARVAWALAHALRARSLPLPVKLYVASSTAPCLGIAVRGWDEPDSGLVDYMRDLGGTPEAILADDAWMADLLRTMRADLTVLGTHSQRPERPLDIPVHAFSGVEDQEAPPSLMSGWAAETAARFDLDTLPCGHFLLGAAERRLLEVIAADPYLRPPGGAQPTTSEMAGRA
jgi:medium-chain acyl-[acyl-carrier-protein] hydrolase